MATITPIKSRKGTRYRAQIRKFQKGRLIYSEAKTFGKRANAVSWARGRETQLEDPQEIKRAQAGGYLVKDLIDLYIRDYGDGFGRSKLSDLKFLKKCQIANEAAAQLTCEQLVDHIRWRLASGVKPQTANNDLIWLGVVYKTAAPAWNIPVDTREIDAAKALCWANKLVAKSESRDRRPTIDELRRLTEYFQRRDGRARIPMVDIMWFAIHSSRRQDEITRLRWSDTNEKHRTGIVRDLKHPRRKKGNDKKFKFTEKAWAIVTRQPRDSDMIFPYKANSIGEAWRRACKVLEIEDLHFHDLRHEATSRLFESRKRYSIVEVQLHTLHEDWKVLQRYTNLRPEDVR